MSLSRVVVTGMGLVSPLGHTVGESWAGIRAGQSGIGPITNFDPATVVNKYAGEVKNFDGEARFGRKEARRMDRATQFALAAAQEALQDSDLEITPENCYDIGCIIGSGIANINTLTETLESFNSKGHRGVNPVKVPALLSDNISARVSIEYGLMGANFCVITACAAGSTAIGEAMNAIRLGRVQAMLAGGSEAAIVSTVVAGFNNMKAMSNSDRPAEEASRPFDRDRDGFIAGEGAAILVLESLEHAQARGARIYAELTGYGHTSDAYHVTAPKEDGESAAQAMIRALRDANLEPEAIDYINAHGTGTALNDVSETLAVKKALGEHAYNVPMSSTKSMTGHMLGATGAAETIFAIMAMQDSFAPPTINLDNPDPACDLDYVPQVGREVPMQHVMNNSFGFGGHNAVLVASRLVEG